MSLNIFQEEQEQNPYSPPSSPPPAHAIFLPETHHPIIADNSSWQASSRKRGPVVASRRYHYARRHLFRLAKTLIKLLFKSNNLLLLASFANQLWKSRLPIILFTHRIMKHVSFIIRYQANYKQMIYFVYNYLLIVFKHQKTSSTQQNYHSTPLLLVLTTKNVGSRWIRDILRNLGGLDSIILAISTITFMRSFQQQHQSNRLIN
ncbi:MAG: hypothetical protein EXX96DRAFT_535964 [Benjaminiella poitrasii]|nr:MAG: hypothetical protein EXX96DRAFT_535964 [Benjaminiella poitrasii]